MKNLFTSVLVAVLLIGATPATQAQQSNKLTFKQTTANKVLDRIVGDWQVSHYVKKADGEGLTETKGSAKFSKAFHGNYVQERYDLSQADGSILQGESYIRYSDEQDRYEYVQLDKKGKSIVMMVGKWSKKYDTLAFRPLNGEGQWSNKIDPNLQCLYIFKHDGTFIRLTRTFDKHGNCIVLTQDHYSYPGVATL
ncbi:DUF1579 domain-containing protein [Pontibacter diazotrophicus]|uniref:DUF1579 domain-containing protein n=1 Tax=Pontibacter diazotrophicus TaxID=1400979 RepID=A0A3D8LD11_9BACT|nr:DUF1579 family protein [Pontibacter diazotrophicus]RDV15295.1 DUF1579 domain-containing protein [Pontibacter diazotrophicus]